MGEYDDLISKSLERIASALERLEGSHRPAGQAGQDAGLDLLDRHDVAKLLSCSALRIDRMTKAGSIPRPVVVSGQHRWLRRWITEYLLRLSPGEHD